MEICLDHKKKYVLGVSGGSDSMALLSLCIAQKLDMVVCFVNYKLRQSADIEEELVKQYCNEHQIKLYCLYPKQESKDNFQKWAREARYEFYKEIYQKEDADYLLLGHQLDDNIENYLMAKQRNSVGWFYGISREITINGMNVIRPLLSYRKAQLRQYCLDNDIPYHDDESNYTDKYTRNKIRHSLVEQADDKQIEQWLEEIAEYNHEVSQKLEYVEKNYKDENVQLNSYIKEEKNIRQVILRYKMYLDNPTYSCSGDFIDSIDQQLCHSNHHFHIKLDENKALYCEYGLFYIAPLKQDYSYKLDKLEYLQTDYFKLVKNGDTIQSVNILDTDWPITIRNGQLGDEIDMRFGHKKLNRFFIDRKILTKERHIWPVIINKDLRVIYICEMGCDLQHFSPNANLFMVKLK